MHAFCTRGATCTQRHDLHSKLLMHSPLRDGRCTGSLGPQTEEGGGEGGARGRRRPGQQRAWVRVPHCLARSAICCHTISRSDATAPSSGRCSTQGSACPRSSGEAPPAPCATGVRRRDVPLHAVKALNSVCTFVRAFVVLAAGPPRAVSTRCRRRAEQHTTALRPGTHTCCCRGQPPRPGSSPAELAARPCEQSTLQDHHSYEKAAASDRVAAADCAGFWPPTAACSAGQVQKQMAHRVALQDAGRGLASGNHCAPTWLGWAAAATRVGRRAGSSNTRSQAARAHALPWTACGEQGTACRRRGRAGRGQVHRSPKPRAPAITRERRRPGEAAWRAIIARHA